MAKPAKLQSHTVSLRFTELLLDVEVPAETLEQAIEKGRALKLTDVVTLDPGTTWLDGGDTTVTGVYCA